MNKLNPLYWLGIVLAITVSVVVLPIVWLANSFIAGVDKGFDIVRRR